MSQFHFDPDTYMDLMRSDVPGYPRLQEEVVRATEGIRVASVLDLGTGAGETLAAVLASHPGAHGTGIDESAAMLEAAGVRLAALAVDLLVADIGDPLPAGPFDLVVSRPGRAPPRRAGQGGALRADRRVPPSGRTFCPG